MHCWPQACVQSSFCCHTVSRMETDWGIRLVSSSTQTVVFKWNIPHPTDVSCVYTGTRAPCIQYLCSWVMHFIIAFAMKPLGRRRRKETTLNGSNVCSGGKRRFSLKPFHCIKYPGLVTHLSSGLLVYPAPCHHFHCMQCTWAPQPLWKWTGMCECVWN